jgi:hypothetical protein
MFGLNRVQLAVFSLFHVITWRMTIGKYALLCRLSYARYVFLGRLPLDCNLVMVGRRAWPPHALQSCASLVRLLLLDRLKARGQTKDSPCSSRVGIGREASNFTLEDNVC